MNVLELRGISKIYKTDSIDTVALDHVDLTIKDGEFVSVFGPSGSGKSTLLHIMGLLDTPTEGSVAIEGKNISSLNEDGLAKIRGLKIGFIFQAYNLLQSLTAIENVMLPLMLYDASEEKARKKAHHLLARLGLEDRIYHKPSQLSGGQQQRVAIARALAMDPAFILADEPTGNLDSKSGKEVLQLFEDLNKEGKTIIVVTHDQSIAHHSNRIINIKDGRIHRDTKQEAAHYHAKEGQK